MLLAQQTVVLIVAAVIALCVMVAVFLAAQRVLTLWLQAYMMATPITLFDILGMRFRKVDAKRVVRAMIMAKQTAIDLPLADLERAYLQGADLEKVTLALIAAKRQNREVSWQELVEADLEDKRRTGEIRP
jgi:uncharacterized protein YqfA (UPF0365 family)